MEINNEGNQIFLSIQKFPEHKLFKNDNLICFQNFGNLLWLDN